MALSGANQILDERGRQRDIEKFTHEHDDQWKGGELVNAAMSYLSATKADREAFANGYLGYSRSREYWPWDMAWWKPRDRISNLVRAGALIAAEIDRLQDLAGDK
jgi:hypothetical protein